MHTKFIAEVSSNHSCDLERCMCFIEEAAKSGCDAIKFQLFTLEKLFSPEALSHNPSLIERKAWELPLDFLPTISKKCKSLEILFGCTPFDLDAVDQLLTYVDFYKVASYELLWDDLLIKVASTGKPMIISTGMATVKEIEHAVKVCRNSGAHDLTVFHCTSAYPTPYYEANLGAIETIRSIPGVDKVGWSDHTVEVGVINRAIQKFNCCAVEFHFDLDGLGAEFGPGHCWLPQQIKKVISDTRISEKADGSGVKEPVPSEIPDRDWRADPKDGLRPLKSKRILLK